MCFNIATRLLLMAERCPSTWARLLYIPVFEAGEEPGGRRPNSPARAGSSFSRQIGPGQLWDFRIQVWLSGCDVPLQRNSSIQFCIG